MAGFELIYGMSLLDFLVTIFVLEVVIAIFVPVLKKASSSGADKADKSKGK